MSANGDQRTEPTPAEDCLFCKIVRGETPCHEIWQDERHLAFLSIYPNTVGFSVVTTKRHYPSYGFGLDDDVLAGLVLAAAHVGRLLDVAFPDVGRTGLILEGFGVNYAHAKLVPMHGTPRGEWRPLSARLDKYFERYEGYISSHDYDRADDDALARQAREIRTHRATLD